MELAAVRAETSAACGDDPSINGSTPHKGREVTDLGFRHIGEGVVDPRFEEMDFGENHPVVQSLEFSEETRDESEGISEGSVIDVEGDETSFEVLLEEDTFLGFGPVDILLG